MAPTLAAVGCEMLRFETGEAVERSPRNRMLVRQSTVVNFLGERHCCSRGEYSTKGSQYRATPRISLPRRDSFFSQTKSCLSGSVHETFPDTIVTNLPGSLSRWIPCGRERCYTSKWITSECPRQIRPQSAAGANPSQRVALDSRI